ncbi:hypothetical protein MOQ_003985 [Trypanosoma cruzi marinkellei]|uniref:Uncharacterized protein n=1 Tax=Trypanosoma cruzi marinkellei TaxID=85056 RepID=K2N2K8_TRYCR|nr:hypothetical protein MOQ_003985 [Trypanosoma cruzi marinkellei]
MKYDSGLLFVRRPAGTAWEWLRPGPCSLRRGAIGVPSLAQVLGGVSGGISGGSGSPRKSNSRSAWKRAMTCALTMCLTTLVRQPQCLPHTERSAGRRITAGWGPAGSRGVSVRRLGVPAVRHPGRINNISSGWRVAVVLPAIRICANPAAEAGWCSLFPTDEGGVRARGLPVACCSGAVSLRLELSDTNNTLGHCDDSDAPCVCEVCEVGRLPGLRITCLVPGHAAVAKDTLHPCARSSVLRATQKGTSTM